MNKLAFLSLLAILGCKNSQNNIGIISIDEIARQEIGPAFEKKDRGDFSLCYTVSKTLVEKWKTVIVINKLNGDIIFGPKRMNADIDWYKDGLLVIKEYPEVIQDKNSTETFIYYYDILQKKKIDPIR